MKRLFIAEKPSLGRAIANGLGKDKSNEGFISCGDDIVTWCFGHILEQAEPQEYDEKYKSWHIQDLPIIPSAWKLNVSKSAAKQFAVIKKLVKEADEIINGGDPDREGQLLVDEVLEYLKNKKRSRGCRMKEKSSWVAPSFSSLINFDYHTYNFMQKLNAKRAHEYNRLFVRYMHASLLFAR